MTVDFHLTPTSGPLGGKLVYATSEYAFRFEADARPNAYSSVQINSLQLALDDKGVLLYPSGYCPLLKSQETELGPPEADRKATLIAKIPSAFIPGVAYALGGATAWPTWMNRKSGWVCLGEPCIEEPFQAVEFATGAIAVVCEARLASVWLHPVTLHAT